MPSTIPFQLAAPSFTPALPRAPEPGPSSVASRPAALASHGLKARAQAAAFALAPSDAEWAKAHAQSALRALAAPRPPDRAPLELATILLQLAFALVVSPGIPDRQVPAKSPGQAG